MMQRLVQRLAGEVWFRVEATFPERVLNLCAQRGLRFWELQWERPTVFTCRLSRRDYHALRRALQHLDCTVTALNRSGAPYFLRHLLVRRPVLAGLGVAAGLGVVISSFFVWDIQVTGNCAVPTEAILRALEHQNVRLGSFGLGLDGEDIRNHVLLELPELWWLTVNVSGCRAEVVVRERTPLPEFTDRSLPSNLVARRGGLVLEVHAFSGAKAVLPGMSVEEGQLLISGVQDTETFGARTSAGLGEVTARTWHTLSTTVPERVQTKVYGEENTFTSLIFGKKRLKFFSNSSIQGHTYDKMTRRTKLSLLGIPLPITLEQETCRFYTLSPLSLSPIEAEKIAETALTAQLASEVNPYGTIRSTLLQRKGQRFTLHSECRESIGDTVPLYLSTHEE